MKTFEIEVKGKDRLYNKINVSVDTETKEIKADALIISGQYAGISFSEFDPAFGAIEYIFDTEYTSLEQNICDEIEIWLSEDGQLEVFCSVA